MKEKIIEKMRERGYSKISENRGTANETISINFIYSPLKEENKKERFPVPSYTATIWIEDETFQFFYSSNSSINVLTTPKCGSFFNDDHFDRIAMQFEHDAAILAKYSM